MATSNHAYQLAAQISTIINKKIKKRIQSITNRVIIWIMLKLPKGGDKKEGLNWWQLHVQSFHNEHQAKGHIVSL